MAWTTTSDWSGLPSEFYQQNPGDELGTYQTGLSDLGSRFVTQSQSAFTSGDNPVNSFSWDPEQYNSYLRANAPQDSIFTGFNAPKTMEGVNEGYLKDVYGASNPQYLTRDIFNEYSPFKYLGYGQQTMDSLWNYAKSQQGAGGGNTGVSGPQIGSLLASQIHSGAAPTGNVWENPNHQWYGDPAAILSNQAGMVGNLLKGAAQSGQNLGLTQDQYNNTMSYLNASQQFQQQQAKDPFFQQWAPTMIGALMTAGTAGMLGPAMAPVAAGAAAGSMGSMIGGANSLGDILQGGVMGAVGGASGATPSDPSKVLGSAAGRAIGTAVGSEIDPRYGGMIGGTLGGAAGGSLGSTLGGLQTDQPWGVNPQQGGSMEFGDYMGDYDTMGDAGMYGGGSLYSSDIPQGFSVDGMSGTGAALPTGGGDIMGQLGQYGPSLLNILGGLFGGGGGGTAPAGGTTGTQSPVTGQQMGGNQGSLFGLISGIQGYNTADRASEKMQQMMAGVQDPYGPYRGQAANWLNTLMNDPMNNPFIKALNDQTMNELNARDAGLAQMYNDPNRQIQKMGVLAQAFPGLAGPGLQASGASTSPSAYGAVQSDMMKSWWPMEMAKAGAIGGSLSQVPGAVQGGVQTVSSILDLIRQLGGAQQA